MGVKKITFLVLLWGMFWGKAWGLRYEELPSLVHHSPLLSPYEHHLKQINSRIKRLTLENGWWLSLSGTYYFNDSYAEDVIGYTFGLSFKLTKNFGGYTSNQLFERFLARLDYLRTDLSREERETVLLWRARFLFVEDLLLEQKAKILAALIRETQTLLRPLRERMLLGFERRRDLDLLADRLFRYRLEEGLCRQQQRRVEELLSLLLGLKEARPEEEGLYVVLPVDLPAPGKADFLEKVSEELSHLSQRKFYPRFKFFLGADRTWNDNSGSLWTGFSVSVPLHFRASERARQEEILALWQRLKSEDELRTTRLKNQAFEHLIGLVSSQGDLLFLARRFSSLLLEKPPEIFDLRRGRSRLKALEVLRDYYDVQLRIFSLLASLGSTLKLEDLPLAQGKEVLLALPPREIAAWWWESKPSSALARQVSQEWGLRRLYFSLNAAQIQKFLQEKDETLPQFILDLYQEGLETEILLGEPTWIFPKARKKLLEILSLLEERLYPLVQTVHLDIEPHALSGFAQNRKEYERLYLETLAEIRKNTPFALVVDVPLYFFREKVFWRGKEALLIEHLSPLVNGVVVMNYLGEPRLFERRAKEVARMLEERGLPYWIGLSIERDVPAEETLHGLSKPTLRRFLREELFEISSSYLFRGLAVQNFKELKDYASPSRTP